VETDASGWRSTCSSRAGASWDAERTDWCQPGYPEFAASEQHGPCGLGRDASMRDHSNKVINYRYDAKIPILGDIPIL
jgi:hypothetical protein